MSCPECEKRRQWIKDKADVGMQRLRQLLYGKSSEPAAGEQSTQPDDKSEPTTGTTKQTPRKRRKAEQPAD